VSPPFLAIILERILRKKGVVGDVVEGVVRVSPPFWLWVTFISLLGR
jgi:hypothetical protein